MAGLCGWLSQSGMVGDPGRVLAQMRAGLGAAGMNECPGAFQAHGITAWSPFDIASVHSAQGIYAAIDGRVRWDDVGLANIAQETSPANALVVAYQRHGKGCLDRMHGTFCFALLEPENNTALLAIDRMGVHGLCFAVRNQALVFGSNADSVVAHPVVGRELDSQGIFNYLFHHMVPAPGSIYSGVEKLLPAQYALFQDGSVTRGFYWEAQWHDGEDANFAQRAEEFRLLLRDCVSSAVEGGGSGAFLSGGTDSSTVAGVLTQVGGKPAETFSIGFQAEGFDEIAYARLASTRFGTHPHEYYVTPDDVVRAIPMVAAAYDEPFGNASAVPAYYCAHNAKQAGINLMLAGDGGDEIFGGNARYAKQKIFEAYWHIPKAVRSALVEPLLLNAPGLDRLALLRKIQSYVRQACVPLPDRLESYNFLHTHPLDEIFTPDFLADVDRDQPVSLMRDPYFRTRSTNSINRMLHLDWKQTLADNDLRKVNRMCEVAGVEVHYPLLDERMVAFAAALPPAYKVRGFKLRWFFKEALKDFLPAEIITKSKHGFGLPFGLWMQEHQPLRDLAYESLHSFRQRGVIAPQYLDQLIDRHRTGHASYYGVMIWVIMMLEQWLQHHIASAR